MGCCVSKKRSEPLGVGAGEARPRKVEARDLPPPEEEKVKEVLSETPNTKPRPRPRRVAGAVAQSVERGGVAVPEKVKAKGGSARVKDGGRVSRAVRAAHVGVEKSEAASESSAATTAAGPERSPAKPPRRQGAVSGELRRARRDHAAAVPGGAGRHGGRASPSPPPPPPMRRDPGERLGRRSPSPATKRSQDQRRDTSAAASCTKRKPPVPARPCSRASPRRAQEAPSPLSPPPPAVVAVQPHEPTHCGSPPAPQAQEDTAASGSGDGAGDGQGNESLENPLVSMECFIFL